MPVQAKFQCNNKVTTQTTSETPTSVRVNLTAVTGAANEEWSKYTPNGSIMMEISNPNASDWFCPGVQYILTFEEAD